MKTKALRIYGKNDLRLEEFELPTLKEDEILAHVVSDSLCMSSYKAAMQGSGHKRIPDDIDKNPTILGHEFCGELVEVGKKWQHKFKSGQKFAIQPALNYKGSLDAPGYSFKYIGGDATYIIIPNEVMEMDCLLPFNGNAYFYGSLAEPMSCIVGAFHVNYHTTPGSYIHKMGIVKGGSMAILAGAGPMGLGAVDYAVHCEHKPALIVVTDIDDSRLKRAAEIIPPEEALKNGVNLHYINTKDMENPVDRLNEISNGRGYDDVYVYAPVPAVVEMGDKLLGNDGCLNFFAGPTDSEFSAKFNFYNVHYASTHIAGNSGGNTDDLKESIMMMEKRLINPAAMITHVGGLDCTAEATLNLPKIPGGKKLIYTNIKMPLTAISDFEKLGSDNEIYKELANIINENNGLWCEQAEKLLLSKGEKI